MNQILLALFILLFGVSVNAENISFVKCQCDDGSEKYYTITDTNSITVKILVTGISETRYLQYVMNNDTVGYTTISEDGVYTLNRYGFGLGSPDHSIALSLLTEPNSSGTQTSNDITLSNITVWMSVPQFTEQEVAISGPLVSAQLLMGGFTLLTGVSNQGGCIEHRLTLTTRATTPEGSTVYSYERILEETFSDQIFDDTFTYDGPQTELCVSYALALKDFGQGQDDFEPSEIAVSEENCVTAGEISTDVSEEMEELGKLMVWPNPFTDSFSVSSTETVNVWSAEGKMVASGSGGVFNTTNLKPGTYFVRGTDTRKAVTVTKITQ
jgi:hypothetical protein